jgi:hypothetical protein
MLIQGDCQVTVWTGDFHEQESSAFVHVPEGYQAQGLTASELVADL